ncbi:methyl-accepting chemotaxis protein [Lysobacter enzymogenes]|uniref:Methyl-accepting chemotaxis protein (MCP) signaling domain n=1 Tax=Lysobacter enzymogenes TaxID=69 RepID=A0A0S2DGX3_LYSEN|nr:methyl-accepting chemotaxis protein [Lysobacter enzymogenes]ALN57802.1 Methyl-accepting chemotaxis protein (MCP) signaling domain [Lysobacter enzymogenes]QCW26323.1 methyl-accepting chemotaxis protein [Lysobacter enzymogenes]QQP99084.1 methyl-accepting chemotaxis protein [Lysobacter enzymogenes]
MINLSIRQRILLSLAVTFGVLALMGGIAWQRLLHIETEEAALRDDSIPGTYAASKMQSSWMTYHANVRAMTIAGSDDLTRLEELVRTRRSQFEAAAVDYDRTIRRADDRAQFAELMRQAQAAFALQAELTRLAQERSPAVATAWRERAAPVFERNNAALDKILDYNRRYASESVARIDQAIAAAKTGIAVSFFVAVVLSGLVGFFLWRAITVPLRQLSGAVQTLAKGDFSKRLALGRSDEFGTLGQGYDRMTDDLSELVGQVQSSGIQVNSSINEITATLREQQASAAQIAATTTEIGATSREIAATSKELVRTMDTVAAAAEQTSSLAGNGQAGLSEMEQSMRRMIEATAAISAKLSVLADKANNISQVVTTITKVADQTNLLSLNAAIEAEKAGEYGRGFSVVANEIRRLADQTAVATLDIEQMVREIQSAVSAGVMGMDKFSEEVRRGTHDVQQVGGQLSQVIDNVQAMVPRFEAVNEGVQAQSAGAEQINLALSQLSEAAQQTVEALRQSNQAIDELHHVSAGLRDGVVKFKLLA